MVKNEVSLTDNFIAWLVYTINMYSNMKNYENIYNCLRRYAANDKIFKLFFLHPFLASTIYNNTVKNKFDIG